MFLHEYADFTAENRLNAKSYDDIAAALCTQNQVTDCFLMISIVSYQNKNRQMGKQLSSKF